MQQHQQQRGKLLDKALKSQLCQDVSFVACMLLKFIPLGRPASTLFVNLVNF